MIAARTIPIKTTITMTTIVTVVLSPSFSSSLLFSENRKNILLGWLNILWKNPTYVVTETLMLREWGF